MAGDWIKVEKDTPEKPEVLGIASRLGVSLGDAFLACFKLWRWADAQTVDGYAPRVTSALLDALCGLPGFSDAACDVGWLEVCDDSLVIPNFIRHMGKPAKARALASNRVSRSRSKCNADRYAPSVTEALPKAQPEKRREEKKNKSPLTPLPIPDSLNTDAFRVAWSDWLAYRKERRSACTRATQERQLKFLEKMGPADAVRCIEASITNGWQGLFPLKDQPNGQPRAPNPAPNPVYEANKRRIEEAERIAREKSTCKQTVTQTDSRS